MKQYKSPSSHSIRAEDNDKEEVTQQASVKKRANPSRKTRKNRPETEVAHFHEHRKENTEKAAGPVPQPPPGPRESQNTGDAGALKSIWCTMKTKN